MIHLRSRTWIAAAALALLAGAVLWLWISRQRMPLAAQIEHLPPGEAIILHIDVAALRRSGLLDLIAGSRAAEESEYKSFVTESGFNYREHLDTVLASFHGGQIYMLLTGRFDWKALEAYAARQRGSCDRSFCRMPASAPGRTISFFPLRSRVMALSSGADPWGAAAMRSPVKTRPAIRAAARPLWLYIPGSFLKSAGEGLPAGTKLYATALGDAESALVWVGVEGGKLEAQIEADCRTEQAAVILKAQLEKVTDLLKKLIVREGERPNPRDLSGVLTQGAFRREGRRVIGRWPLDRAFLESLTGGN